ncbi:MAG: hypothetical protein ACTSO7_15630 [Candidatus Heimdallarchaeota archaeon]
MMNVKNEEISTQIDLKDTITLCENSLIQDGLNIDTLWRLADCHYLEGNFFLASTIISTPTQRVLFKKAKMKKKHLLE